MMLLEISWTRTAMELPPEARTELTKRLRILHRFYPEMKTKIKIGITRSLDGLAFQSEEGLVKLMVDVHRTRKSGWKYPTYWTLAHELMHLAQFNSHGIPGGERACDMFALARLEPRYIDDSPSYLVVPGRIRAGWGLKHAKLAHELAREALEKRRQGLRRYATWWEEEFETRTKNARKPHSWAPQN